jgi:hypothetical protein
MATAIAGVQTNAQYSAADITAGRTPGLTDEAFLHDNSKWVFVSASASITSYQLVAINSAGVALAATSALALAGQKCGVAQAAISSGSYGWVQVKGNMTVNALQTCSSSTVLYTTGTAGAVDDTATSQVKIANLTLNSNNATTGTVATAAYAPADLFFAF